MPKIYWLQHCRCWFGFYEPVEFVTSPAGGYFPSMFSNEGSMSVSGNKARAAIAKVTGQ